MVGPKVELLWWRGCPSWEGALADLEAAMAEGGLDPATIAVREIADEADAARTAFPGSPTIRVDGTDVQEPGPLEGSPLTCRIYRRRDGRVSPLPDPDDLREALSAARANADQSP